MVAGSVMSIYYTQFEAWLVGSSTSEVDLSLFASLHSDGLVVGFVALHLEAGRRLVAHEALLTLQHQHRPSPPHNNATQSVHIKTLTKLRINKCKECRGCDANLVIAISVKRK